MEQSQSDSDKNDSDTETKSSKSKKRPRNDGVVIPAVSLTRTLIQALHSSDSRLLETCLAHSDSVLINNTVRKLPPQLAVTLITACVDRLAGGARSGNTKGRGGGASSQRGTSLVTWIRAVLAMHSGHLITIPDLVAKLSGLHTALTARLALQQSLLSLGGRLELVLSQMQMRSSVAPTLLDTKSNNGQSKADEAMKYVEGESDESEDEAMDAQNDHDDDDDGSIEDVELGGDSEEVESDDETGEADIEDDDNELEDPPVNGFTDDEAEEYSNEDDSDDY
ncbi:hypothetical protein AMATHDRAFT_52497 [Amanita thiersii Skay4041]|uniref:Small-subunit processome Utp12 domain-containing protein n=1 Tax=Amanita thiersii Skay4041 TaxID=703135 RepID=A0A2A9NYM6_9AGAR|nr:hypothetical protein AMATHDRAFT_52497 [Amanita thiersii Skay4041]